MTTKYWARLIPDDVAKRAQVVFASDYDALAAELADCKSFNTQLAHAALANEQKIGRLESAVHDLLAGVILDLRHSDLDDDKEAMQSRVKTVTDALGFTAETKVAPKGEYWSKSDPAPWSNDVLPPDDSEPNRQTKGEQG